MATSATMSGLQFDALPYDEGRRLELLEGDLIEVSSPTPRHQAIVRRILIALQRYLDEERGAAFPDLEFALSDLLRLRPDVCVLLGIKARELDLDRTPVPGAPDIAIEVISPTERASESYDKIRAYLRNGVTEAWQVFPRSQAVEIHRGTASFSLDATQSISSDLLPGLQIPVASLFA
ncbi:MAG TPA: Uma2 family endonuclease [Bryobacteraceae bacterium]|jgi:Uma2 family endonuclease|nr:Uma2 family endonuclease [Bryobacteraceae bacterium]